MKDTNENTGIPSRGRPKKRCDDDERQNYNLNNSHAWNNQEIYNKNVDRMGESLNPKILNSQHVSNQGDFMTAEEIQREFTLYSQTLRTEGYPSNILHDMKHHKQPTERTYSNTYNAINSSKQETKSNKAPDASVGKRFEQNNSYSGQMNTKQLQYNHLYKEAYNDPYKEAYSAQTVPQPLFNIDTSYYEESQVPPNQYFHPSVFTDQNSAQQSLPERHDPDEQEYTSNQFLNRRICDLNPYKNLNNMENHLTSPSEYSSVDYINAPDKNKKMFLGTMRHTYNKVQSNNSVLPIFLNTAPCYDSPSIQEFERIGRAFMYKTAPFDYENVTVQQLKVLMKEFGLSHTGKKHELIERVQKTAEMIKERFNLYRRLTNSNIEGNNSNITEGTNHNQMPSENPENITPIVNNKEGPIDWQSIKNGLYKGNLDPNMCDEDGNPLDWLFF